MEELYDFKKALDNLRFDATILIFGFNNGEYIKELNSLICQKNKVYIFEPNKIDFKKYKNTIKEKNISLVSMHDKNFDNLLSEIITTKNLFNINIQIYGNYDENYKNEYDKFIKSIDENFFSCSVISSTEDSFKNLFANNILSNISKLNSCAKFESYISKNKDNPAIIVSAGPSLDENIKDLVKNKDKLHKFLIIAGNRTVEPLLKNNIIPDLVLSIDPQEITYNMMKNCLDNNSALIFCEKSNAKVINEYKGLKIGISQGILNSIDTLEKSLVCMSGGSIVHVATDVAFLMECNPIIFLGQDFAYTYEKDHALIAKNELDENINIKNSILTKDVYGNDIYTSELLNLYKKNLENLINIYKLSNKDTKFINCSYGASIKNTTHENLDKVLNTDYNNTDKIDFYKEFEFYNIDYDKFKESLLQYIDNTLYNAEKSIKICEELLINPNFNNINNFKFVIETIDNFIKDKNSVYFQGYISTFLIYIKEKLFKMKACDYYRLSGDLNYQCNIFKNYMQELEILLKELKNIIILY